MSSIIKGLRAAMLPRWQPDVFDFITQRDGCLTTEERRVLELATAIYAGKVVVLDSYRERRRCEAVPPCWPCGRVPKVCCRCEERIRIALMARKEGPPWE